MKDKKYVVLFDNVNRTILGVLNERLSDINHLAIENPAIIAVGFGEKMQMQLIPVFFRELTANSNADMTMFYGRANTTQTNVVPSNVVIERYAALFAPIDQKAVVPEVHIVEKDK